MQKSETREVEEFFAKGQKGSSAMPHKRNPIGSENMTGMARVIRGYMMTAYENVPFGMNVIFHILLQNASFYQMQRSH